jgi:glutamine amidotransferase
VHITILDYGAGNLHSMQKALEVAGAEVVVEADPLRCLRTDLLVLPGVGAFGAAAARLAPARSQLRHALENGLPAIGVCLGMQLLFDASDEGDGDGIGLLQGRVTRLRARRVPQIGWNTLQESRDALLARTGLTTAYFANGYACRPVDDACVTAWATHEGDRFPAMVRAGRVLGMQFHPEKSSRDGLRLLHAAIAEAGS